MLWAADFWEAKSYTEWSTKEVDRVLNRSPWSQDVTIRMVGSFGGGAGADGRLAAQVVAVKVAVAAAVAVPMAVAVAVVRASAERVVAAAAPTVVAAAAAAALAAPEAVWACRR